MTQQVQLPDGSIAEFPDDMSQDQIAGVIKQHLGQTAAPKQPDLQAVDPGFFGRLGQYADRNVAGKPLPPLAQNAGFGSQAADTLERGRDYLSGLGDTLTNALTYGVSNDVAGLAHATRNQINQALTPNTIANVVAKESGAQQPANFLADYQQGRDANIAANAKFKAANPIAGTTADIVGAITSPISGVGGNYVTSGSNIFTRALRAAGVGAGLGGVSGFENAPGGLDNRLKAGGFSSAAGAVAGGLLTPLVELGTQGGRAVYNTIANQVRAASDPQGQAERLLANALLRDQQSVPEAIQAVQAAPDLGLVNAGGENVSALGRQATVAPGNARQQAADFFEQQAGGMADRGADALSTLTPNGYYGTVEQLDQTRRAAAQPLYEAAYNQPAVDQWSPEIANLMQRPSMRDAAGRAARIAAEEGRNPAELGLTFNAAGDPVFVAGANANGQIPSVQTMDYMKRGLDDVLEQYRDPVTGRLNLDTAGRAAQNTRAQFVQALRAGNDNYRQALDAWGGPSHALDMIQYGRDLWKSVGDPADRLRQFANMPAADQEMVRTGLMREALNKIGNLGDNSSVYNALFGNSNKRQVFSQLFQSPEQFNQFANAMRLEQSLLRTNRMVMGGSPTARIQAENADAMQQLGTRLGIFRQLLTGHPLAAAGTAITQAGNLQRGMSEPVANELGTILFNPDTQANIGLLNNLQGNAAQPGILSILQQQQLRNQNLGLLGQTSMGGLLGQLAGKFGVAATGN